MNRASIRGLLCLISVSAFFSGCFNDRATISTIDPRIGSGGDTLIIYGEGFGADRGNNYIKIAGIAPTASAYLSWTKNQIIVKVPDFGDSGLVYVFMDDKPSNAALFSNRDSLPRIPLATVDQTKPAIAQVDPAQAGIGSLVTLSGRNFGSNQDGSVVLFSWEALSQAAQSPTQSLPDVVEVQTGDLAYEAWSDTEIKVRVPDGALTGSVYIRTAKGLSEPCSFTVVDKPGTKTFTEKRSYAIAYSVNIDVAKTSGSGTIFIWMPFPPASAAQRNVQLLSRSLEPFVEAYRGVSLFQLNIEAPSTFTISVNYLVDVYAVETQIKAAAVKRGLDSPLREKFTQADPLIPARRDDIVRQTEKIISKERNPYLQAKKIYDWFISDFSIKADNPPVSLAVALSSKKADIYSAALLYCACLRAAGVPAIPLGGYLIDKTRSVRRHWWVEFWIDGLGWIPVDPALGAGAAPSDFTVKDDPRAFYFGGMDNQRIVLSRSIAELESMDPRGKAVTRDRAPAFQTFWEESTGGIESYSSLWNDISVTGIY